MAGVVLILGRLDHPTDGVADYSEKLVEVLTGRDLEAELIRVRWETEGWFRAAKRLHKALRRQAPDWTLLQFTHLMWSRRGFSLRALAIAWIARRCSSRFGVVMHDPSEYGGRRIRDRTRSRFQRAVMKKLARGAHHVFCAVDAYGLKWSQGLSNDSISLVAIGSAVEPRYSSTYPRLRPAGLTLAVFSFSEGKLEELRDLAQICTLVLAEVRPLELLLLGRGSEVASKFLREQIADRAVNLSATGVTSEETLSAELARADALLFIRGGISARRSTVAAAIAHRLPIVGYADWDTTRPVTEAGLVLAARGQTHELARSLVRLSKSPTWAEELAARSERAYEAYFSWEQIGEMFARVIAHQALPAEGT